MLCRICFAQLAQNLGQFKVALRLGRFEFDRLLQLLFGARIVLKLLQSAAEIETGAVAVGIELCRSFKCLRAATKSPLVRSSTPFK